MIIRRGDQLSKLLNIWTKKWWDPHKDDGETAEGNQPMTRGGLGAHGLDSSELEPVVCAARKLSTCSNTSHPICPGVSRARTPGRSIWTVRFSTSAKSGAPSAELYPNFLARIESHISTPFSFHLFTCTHFRA